MKKIFLMLLLLLLALPCIASADEGSECMANFYQTRNSACISMLINELPKQGNKINPAVLGFFAEILRSDPQERMRILKKNIPSSVKPLIIEALYLAELPDEAQTYANASGFPQIVTVMQSQRLVAVSRIKPIANPADNDMLIGAYMASGNKEYIEKMLENFSTADNGMISDGFRLSMMQGKFGPSMVPPNRGKGIPVKAACKKYECKKDMHNLLRVMTLSSALWAIQSLSRQDTGIKKIFADYFGNDHR
ncbi:MAG: hypothetical protein ABFD50_03625, partial [Smithella sp.]